MLQLKQHNLEIDQNAEQVKFRHCNYRQLAQALQLQRENATTGQAEACATSYKLEEFQSKHLLIDNVSTEYKEYKLLFIEPLKDKALLAYKLQNYKILLEEGKTPLFRPIYQLLELELKELKVYINKNLKKGFIQLSILLAASPILFVLKKDRKLRLYIDYR